MCGVGGHQILPDWIMLWCYIKHKIWIDVIEVVTKPWHNFQQNLL